MKKKAEANLRADEIDPGIFCMLRCPTCCNAEMELNDDDHLNCSSCGENYLKIGDSPVYSLLKENSGTAIKADIQVWWGDLYRQLYAEHETTYTPETLVAALEELEEMFRVRRHLAGMEFPVGDITEKKILEIGPGGGGHSALFKKHGADVTAVDITAERALGTNIKLMLVPSGLGRAYQADAENLPFQDNSFDIVYSNGVLHHSEDTDRCIDEVYRVLKPGGQAFIMLYSRHSATYWLNILPRALITGEFFRWPEAQWVGRLTEGTPKFSEVRNPITRIYSERQLRKLFSDFDIQSLRKGSFQFDNFCIPRLTQIRNAIFSLFGRKPHRGGILVYGQPYQTETVLELFLGRFIGFAWNIVAKKHSGKMEAAL